MQPMHLPSHPASVSMSLIFVRHGATGQNLAGVRCGGDLDVPLAELGRQQALTAAARIADLGRSISLVITSGLKRTDETANIIAEQLGVRRVITLPGLAERRMGRWNLRPISETEAWLASGQSPPGGESNDAFLARIGVATIGIRPLLHQGVLMVGSKGVARALSELTSSRPNPSLGNGQVMQFDLTRVERREAIGSPP